MVLRFCAFIDLSENYFTNQKDNEGMVVYRVRYCLLQSCSAAPEGSPFAFYSGIKAYFVKEFTF